MAGEASDNKIRRIQVHPPGRATAHPRGRSSRLVPFGSLGGLHVGIPFGLSRGTDPTRMPSGIPLMGGTPIGHTT